VRSNADQALAASPRKQACGDCPYKPQQRSQAAHNHLFAIITAAEKLWPADHPFQPEDAEHLRSYLLVKARHFDKLDVKCKNADAIGLRMQLDAIIRAFCDGKPPLMHSYSWGIRIFKPRSISYAAADRKVFNAVSETVFEILEVTLGVKIEDLRRDAHMEAA
jgi:hypothetical protein